MQCIMLVDSRLTIVFVLFLMQALQTGNTGTQGEHATDTTWVSITYGFQPVQTHDNNSVVGGACALSYNSVSCAQFFNC